MSTKPMSDARMIRFAHSVLQTERVAIEQLRIGKAFVSAARTIHRCKGNVVVTGMGKAYLVGQKLSATLASTGSPSLTLHPADALHGDLGRVRKGDVVLLLSNAGETEEVVRLIEPLRTIGTTLIAVTGRSKSTLGRSSDIVLDIGQIEEACPLGLAPTASTTSMLVLGDALALTVLRLRDFSRGDFARYHPAGNLGRKLLTVDQVMRTGERTLTVRPTWTVAKMLKLDSQSTYRSSGAAMVTDARGKLLGIFTDGDLRTRLVGGDGSLLKKKMSEVMISSPKHVVSGQPATEAARIMKTHQIDVLPVVDHRGRFIGLIDIQDLLAKGVNL